MDFGIRFGFVVIDDDNLKKNELRKELSKEATIIEESDGSVENKYGETVPLWCYLMDGSLADYLRIKMKYNCEEQNWLLFPRNPGETRSIFVN